MSVRVQYIFCLLVFLLLATASPADAGVRFAGSEIDKDVRIDASHTEGKIQYKPLSFEMGPGFTMVDISHAIQEKSNHFFPKLGSESAIGTIMILMGPDTPPMKGQAAYFALWLRAYDYDNPPYPLMAAFNLGINATGAYVQSFDDKDQDGRHDYIEDNGFVLQASTTHLKIEITKTDLVFLCSGDGGAEWNQVYACPINAATSHGIDLRGGNLVIGLASLHDSTPWQVKHMEWSGASVPDVNIPSEHHTGDGLEEKPSVMIPPKNNYLPRVDFGQFLEPQGNHIIHGAGALSHFDWSSIYAYQNVMLDRRPMAIMSWITLKHASSPLYDQWRELLKNLPPSEWPAAQIGMNFNLNEIPENHFENEVAAGAYDQELQQLFTDIKRLEIPVLLRVGLASNASFHNYEPEAYKEAFRRTWRIMHETGAENAALVWDFVPFEPDTDFMKFYPGDDVVDWWALEVFKIQDIARPCSKAFLKAAEEHRKPVLLSETTPLGAPQTNDALAWDQWFAPFFAFIAENPVIKAVCYINWDWRTYQKWENWGDRRLESNAFIATRYYREMGDPIWLNATDRTNVQQQLHGKEE